MMYLLALAIAVDIACIFIVVVVTDLMTITKNDYGPRSIL